MLSSLRLPPWIRLPSSLTYCILIMQEKSTPQALFEMSALLQLVKMTCMPCKFVLISPTSSAHVLYLCSWLLLVL